MQQTDRKQMTVADLRAALADLPDEMPVVITAYESGFTAPTVRRIALIHRGTDSELPHVFGEWDEPRYSNDRPIIGAIALER